MENRIEQYIIERKLIQKGQRIGVATSGGPDSMALLSCLLGLSHRLSIRITCIHFEHGIRGQRSVADAEFVRSYCAQNAIPYLGGSGDVPALATQWGMSIESAAKRAREEYFESLVQQGKVDSIATGHHLDDNAESVLMHIIRGSGLGGLVGIHSRYGPYIRPLLCVTQADIYEYLEQHGIPSVLDESNLQTDHSRNYVRNVLVPSIEQHLNSDVTAALNRLSQLARTDHDYLHSQAEQVLERMGDVEKDSIRLGASALAALHPALSGRVVRLALGRLGAKQDIEKKHVRAVLALASKQSTGGRIDLPHGLMAQREYGQLALCRRSAHRADPTAAYCVPFSLHGTTHLPTGGRLVAEQTEQSRQVVCPYTEYLDHGKLHSIAHTLAVRTRRPGDIIRPLGSPGRKKLKDYFIDKKVPRHQRDHIPLLAEGPNIIWVVGHIISDDYKMAAHTPQSIKISYTPPAWADQPKTKERQV